MTNSSELRIAYQKGIDKIKEIFYKNYKFELNEEDNNPFYLTLRDIIESLPPTTYVVEIKGPLRNITPIVAKGFIFVYDYAQLKSDKFEFYGTVDCRYPEQLETLLTEKFEIDENNARSYSEGICISKNILTGWYLSGQTKHFRFFPYDILSNPEEFHVSLYRNFMDDPRIDLYFKQFKRSLHPDYNKIFNLTSDPIISFNELTKSDSRGMLNFALSYVQESISKIQLIPNVPESVKHAFKVSKDLFIFGYFRYEFFTISQHYAFLALEAAIKTRYAMSLGKTAILTMPNTKLRHEIPVPSYHLIEEFCRNAKKQGWNVRTIKVNDKIFPYSGRKLVQWLVNEKIIRKWESDLYDAGLYIRNSLSHLEQMSIHYPSATILQRVSDQINYLFHATQ